MMTTVVTTKGQVVIPSRIRRHLNIKSGTKVYIEEDGQKIIIKPLNAEYFNQIAGILGTKGKLSNQLLEERAKEKQRENKL